MKTRITELLGIEQPIIQGGMAWIADAKLAAAVSEAGGLGIIACGSAPVSWVREQVEEARRLTDKPFGLNIMLMNPEAPDVASAALARRMERCGADAVVAEGCEAGGHIGELTTMALTPAVCDAVSIPVIAAGGIADGRGFAAAVALGAEGVQVGTRFLTATECGVDNAYKQKVLGAKDSDTIFTGRAGGHPVRGIKNKFARNVRKLEADPANVALLESELAGSLHRAVAGDVDNGSLMAGQVACLVNDEKSAAQIVDDLVAEAQSWAGEGLQRMLDANARRAWNTEVR